jgi:hypothetical protein
MGIAVTLARRVALPGRSGEHRRFVYSLQVRIARHRQHSQARSLARRLCPRYGRATDRLPHHAPGRPQGASCSRTAAFQGPRFQLVAAVRLRLALARPAARERGIDPGHHHPSGWRSARNRTRRHRMRRRMARRHIDNLAAGRTISPDMGRTKGSRSSHQTDHHTSACKRWRLAAILLLGPCRCERTGIAHVASGGLDPAVGALDVRDPELVDMAVEGIGDAAHMSPDAKGS